MIRWLGWWRRRRKLYVQWTTIDGRCGCAVRSDYRDCRRAGFPTGCPNRPTDRPWISRLTLGLWRH